MVSEAGSPHVLYNPISFKMALGSFFCALLMLSMNECKHLHHQKQISSYHPECPSRSPQKQDLTLQNGSEQTELMGGPYRKMAYKLH